MPAVSSEEPLLGWYVRRDDPLGQLANNSTSAFLVSQHKQDLDGTMDKLNELEIELIAPLIKNNETIGLLCLGAGVAEAKYGEERLEIVGILTNILSVAIDNSRMFERIRDLSYTDGMTGLHNYRFFRLRLKQEIAPRQPRKLLPLAHHYGCGQF